MSEGEGKKAGVITHYFPKVQAAVVKFETDVKIGDKVKIVGQRGESHEQFEVEQEVSSLQKDRTPVDSAKSGDELGMKVEKEVQEGDEVYLI